jgi:ribonuclease HI
MVDEISRGFENLSSTRACLLDLSKAYDRISPVYAEIALRRLGLTGPFLSSIMDFIKGRRFVVQTHRGARTTKVRSQNGGLPQGSSLSCLIFLLTLDSVQSVIDSFKLYGVRCCAYADDLVVWITGSSPRKMAAVLQKLVDRVVSHLESCGHSINIDKCEVLTFTLKKKLGIKPLKIHNLAVKEVSKVKYLGVILDKKLSWVHHVSHIASKLNVKMEIFKRIAAPYAGASQLTLLNIFKSCIMPIALYGSEFYAKTKVSVKKITGVLTKMLKMAVGLLNRTSTDLSYIFCDIMPFKFQAEMQADLCALRTKSYGSNHPCFSLFSATYERRLLSVYSPTAVIDCQDIYLPNRDVLAIPPWDSELKNIKINTTVRGLTKKDNRWSLKYAVQEMMAELRSEYDLLVYTDGSVIMNQNKAASAGFFESSVMTPPASFSIAGFCYGNSFDQEVLAIKHALEIIERNNYSNISIVFLVDNQAVLSGVQDYKGEPRLMELRAQIMRVATNCRLLLQWIPSHSGFVALSGNEKADALCNTLAKRINSDECRNETSLKMISNDLHRKYRLAWLQSWRLSQTGNRQRRDLNLLEPPTMTKIMPRKINTALNRMRVLTIRSMKTPDNVCPFCNSSIPIVSLVEHLLFTCNIFVIQRSSAFGSISLSRLTLKSVLYDDLLEPKLIKFIEECKKTNSDII